MLDYGSKFKEGLTYEEFLAKHGTEDHRRKWGVMHSRIALSAAQKELLSGWIREMKVICLAGAWCGDCVNQCPIFDHFAAATSKIHVRYFDRDLNPDLGKALSVCGAARVPAVLFLSEDDHQCGFYGDRTLSRYRILGSELSGAACSTGLPTDMGLVNAVVQDWLDEFERIQLILRTSGRLRQKHGD
jgi:thiol-disulfide isomerase/thioredoxin